MSRNALFGVAAALGVLGAVLLVSGMVLLNKNVRDHVSENYRQYSADGGDGRYECSGSPKSVADDIAAYDAPESRASDRGSEYLRYPDDIVIVDRTAGTRAASGWRTSTPATAVAGSFFRPGVHPGLTSGRLGR